MIKFDFHEEDIYENINFNSDNIEKDLYLEIAEGNTFRFILIINGNKILFHEADQDTGVSLPHWHFVREVNNAFHELLKEGKSSIYVGNSEKDILILLSLKGENVVFGVNRTDLKGCYSGLVLLDGMTVSLEEVMNEVVKMINKYKKLFNQIIEKIPVQKRKEFLERTVVPSIPYGVSSVFPLDIEKWLPLEKRWAGYKK